MSSNPRVVLISEFFPHSEHGEARGGVEMRAWEVSRGLADYFDVHVVTSRQPGLAARQALDGITVHRVGSERVYSHAGSLWHRYQFMRRAYRAVVSLQPNLMDAQSLVAYWPAIRAARELKCASIATIHDVWHGRWVQLFGIMGIIGELYERHVLHAPWDHIISNSHFTKQHIVSAGVTEGKVTVVHNGIHIDEVQSIKTEKYNRPTICAITRLVPYKRVSDLIEAVALLQRHIPNIHCRIIGSGIEFERLQKLIYAKGLVENVTLHGFVQHRRDVLKILKSSQAFCLPSSVEGFGIVVAEAMAAGVPCVVSDIPAISEVTHRGKAALQYPMGDIAALARALRETLGSTEQVQVKQQYASQIVGQYSWGRIVAQTKELYQQVL